MAGKKYRAKPTEYNGITYPSMLEADFAKCLDDLKSRGEIVFWLRQTPFYFYDGSRYVCDFQLFMTDGRVLFMETKGRNTTDFNRKLGLMEREYPSVDLIVVRRRGRSDGFTYEDATGQEIPSPF